MVRGNRHYSLRSYTMSTVKMLVFFFIHPPTFSSTNCTIIFSDEPQELANINLRKHRMNAGDEDLELSRKSRRTTPLLNDALVSNSESSSSTRPSISRQTPKNEVSLNFCIKSYCEIMIMNSIEIEVLGFIDYTKYRFIYHFIVIFSWYTYIFSRCHYNLHYLIGHILLIQYYNTILKIKRILAHLFLRS